MKQMQWFRLYSEARTDAKLRSLADDEFRVWFNLLCYASDQDGERGAFDASDRFLIALECAGGDEELLSRVVTRLSRLRIIEDREGVIRFINFEERQYDKPSDTPSQTRERKRKQRANTREAVEEAPTSRDVTPGHAQRREEQRRIETEQRRGDEKPRAGARESGVSPPPKQAVPQPKPNESPPDDGPPPFEYLVALCEATGTDVSELSDSTRTRQCGVAKRLRGAGMTPDDVRRCAGFLRSQTWRTNGISLESIEKERSGWELAGKPAVATGNGRASPAANGTRSTPYERSMAAVDEVFGRTNEIETTGVLKQ